MDVVKFFALSIIFGFGAYLGVVTGQAFRDIFNFFVELVASALFKKNVDNNG